MAYTVYRFLNDRLEVIYVGRTTKLMSRMNTHFNGEGHLPAECYEQVYRIDYMEVQTNSDMKIKELYYISKYKPRFNTADVDDVSFPFNELQDIWVTFDRHKERKALKENTLLSAEVAKQSSDKDALLLENETLMKTVAELEEKLINLGTKKRTEHVFRVTEHSKDVSYSKALASIRENPEKVFVNIVDGEVELALFSYNQEILGQIYRLEPFSEYVTGQSHETIVLESPIEKRRGTAQREYPKLKLIELMFTLTVCNNWVESTDSLTVEALRESVEIPS